MKAFDSLKILSILFLFAPGIGLLAQVQQIPEIGAQAEELQMIENAGQHSAVHQAVLMKDLQHDLTRLKWSIKLRERSRRTHPASELDSIKAYKTVGKFDSYKAPENQKLKKSSAANPVIGSNFEGNWSVTSHPPDNNIAISNGGKIVSVNNDGVEYYDQSGNLLYLDNWSDFINDNTLNSSIYDPVILYDSQEDRFIMAVLHGTSSTTSKVILLFSKSNDPMNGWWIYQLSGNPLNDNSWFDYPKIGVSAQEVYITGNLYDNNDNYNESILYQVNKAEGLSGQNLNYQWWFNLSSQPFPAFTLVPTTYGHQGNIGPGMLFVSTRPGGENRVILWQLTDYLSNNPSLNSFTVSNVTAYSPAGNGAMPNTSKQLDNSDCRILNAFWLDNTVHYVFHSDVGQGWNGIHYNRLDVNNLSNQTATLGKPGVEDYSFPVIASFATTTTDPSVAVSFLHSSPSIFPSTSVVSCNANMQWSAPVLIQAGTSHINFLGGNTERWGDYNGMSRKHNSATPVVWSATSFGTDIVASGGTLPNTYKTWIAQVQTTGISIPENHPDEKYARAYPNPVSDLLHIDFELERREYIEIELFDLTGKLVKLLYADRPRSTALQLSFNTEALGSGQYLLVISNHEKQLQSEKILVP